MTGQTSTVTHSPTPWRLLDNTSGGRSLVHVEVEETLAPVCSIPKTRIADAALIVEAVNSHAALTARVAELSSVLRELAFLKVKGHALIDRLAFSDEGRALAEKIRRALLAKGA